MNEQLEQYVKQIKERHEDCRGNEQATKQCLIGPLFAILGYDMADPRECKPEFRADFGKGEKAATPVDWAFLINSVLAFFVEAKEVGAKIPRYAEQLGMYFAKEPAVKLGILTNGVQWQFYTDLDNVHVMDKEPFLIWNVLQDELIPLDFLTILQKSQFKQQLIRTFAERKHHQSLLVDELTRLLEPSPEFVKLAVQNIETRNLLPKVIEEWKPILANAIQEWAKRFTLGVALLPRPTGVPTSGRPLEKGGKAKRSGLGVTLADLLAAGYLVAPLALFRQYKGRRMEATLMPDSKVEFEGTVYDSCSTAAEAARSTVTGRRMNTNGWIFWQYEGDQGQPLCLDHARQRFRKAKVKS